MSVILPLSLITPQHQKLIQQFLVIKAKENFFQQRKRWNHSSSEIQTTTLIFYQISSSYIYLPYFFANYLFQSLLNFQHFSEYPSVDYLFQGSLLPHQTSIIEEASSQLNQWGTITLNLYTGAGKTIIAIYLASLTKKLTLVLCTMSILIPQWEQAFHQFTNARVWVIGQKMPSGEINVIISMDTQITKIPPQIAKLVGTLLIDECHLFCTKSSIPSLLYCQPLYIIAMSATPERDDGLDLVIKNLCGSHQVVRKSTKISKVYQLNTQVNYPIEYTRQGDPDWTKYVDQVISNPETNTIILKLVQHFREEKILILTCRVKHVDFLYHCLLDQKENVDFLTGKKKTYQDSRVLIGNISKMGVGFDDKNAAGDTWLGMRINTLILCMTIKSLPCLNQAIGRILRCDEPQVIVLTNNSTFSKKHWKIMSHWFREEKKYHVEDFNFNNNSKIEKMT